MKEKLDIEQLFKTKLDSAEASPSEAVWKKTMRSYRRKQFLRFNAGRLNIYYASGLVLAGLILGTSQTIKRSTDNATSQISTNTAVDQKYENTNKPVNEEPISETITSTGVSNEQSPDGQRSDASELLDSKVGQELTNKAGIDQNQKVSEEQALEELPDQQVETLIAYFTPSLYEGCAPLEVCFTNSSLNGDTFRWTVGPDHESIVGKDLTYTFTEEGTHIVTLYVSNSEGISQSYSEQITVHPSPKSEFLIENGVVYNNSMNATGFKWWLNGTLNDEISTDFQPDFELFQSYNSGSKKNELILVATNIFGCTDTAQALLPEIENREIVFPSAFLLNSNGPSGGYYNITDPDNTIFHPIYNENPASYELRIFNKAGELIFVSTDILIGWDGYYKETEAARGVYVYVCNGTWSNGQTFHYRGDITLL